MSQSLAETLRRLRTEKGLTQQQLASQLYVDRSSVAHWESGRRVPDAMLLSRIAAALDADVSLLLSAAADKGDEKPRVILVDDERIVLTGGLPILEQTHAVLYEGKSCGDAVSELLGRDLKDELPSS